MYSRLLYFVVLASTILATTARYLIQYGPDISKCLETTIQGLGRIAMLRDCNNSSSLHQGWMDTMDGKNQQSIDTDYCLGTDNPQKGAILTEIPCQNARAWTYNATSHQYIYDSHFCMDLYEGDMTKQVQLWDCEPNHTNQEWSFYIVDYFKPEVKPEINTTYSIQYGPDNSKCLETTKEGLMLRNCNNSNPLHQNWTMVGDTSKIYSPYPGICLDADYTSLIQLSCDDAVLWTYNTTSNQYKYGNKNRCMDLYEGDTTKQVQLWDCDPTHINQKWTRNVLHHN